jgi:hypothetical protein
LNAISRGATFAVAKSAAATTAGTEKMRFLGDVGGDVASATASSEELRWVTWPLA